MESQATDDTCLSSEAAVKKPAIGATAPPSVFPRDGSGIDRFDKVISGPILRLQLGIVVEYLLSVPGCFFGMPSTMMIGPGLLAVSATRTSNENRKLPMMILGIIIATLIFRWGCCHWTSTLKWGFYGRRMFLVAPFLGTALTYAIADDPIAQYAGNFYLTSWLLVLIPVLFLKRVTHRRRPIASAVVHLGESSALAGRQLKSLDWMCHMLRTGDSNASFPSGDVAGSVTFAYPLWRYHQGGASSVGVVAVIIVLLSAFGRIYWHAHHALDVIVAMIIAFYCCSILDARLSSSFHTESGNNTYPIVAWYHPYIAMMGVIVQQKLLPQKFVGWKKKSK